MELELKTTHLNSYDTVLDTTVFQEETMESIVPDACPDIQRILDTEAMVCLRSKEAQEGRVEVAGTARCAILYLPDGAEGPRRITVSMPFTSAAEAAGIRSSCVVIAVPRVLSADTRILNPRKVLTRISLAVDIRVYCPISDSICDSVESEPAAGIRQLLETQQINLVSAVGEKPFTFSDDLNFPGARPPAAELLKSRVDLVCNDSKIIGNKLIFKGEANLRLVYRNSSGGLSTVAFELPFSQIMEVSGVGEDAECSLQVVLTGCDCTLEGGEGRTVAVSLSMLAQASVQEERQISMLSDIYSTAFQLSVQHCEHSFSKVVENDEHRVNIREMMETPVQMRDVLDVYVNIGEVTQRREENKSILSAETFVTLLCMGEDDNLYTVNKSVPATCPVELPKGVSCSAHCACSGECSATSVGGGVEIRYLLAFHCLARQTINAVGVSEMHLEENSPRDSSAQPSIVLRMVGEGERLWDIAKVYGTTTEEITQANALSEETLPAGQVLLIPKKR